MKTTRITEEEVKCQAFQPREEVTGSSPRSFAAVAGGYNGFLGVMSRENFLLPQSDRCGL
jgi:hypothetical protein